MGEWQAWPVETWMIALVATLMIGLVVLFYGAARDRRINRERAREALAPPSTEIPGFTPTSTPAYLTEVQARRPKPPLPLCEEDERRIARLLADGTTVASGWASPPFATDAERSRAVLLDADVLVTDAAIDDVRSLIGPLERAIASGRGLVVVAPSLADEVLRTLEVNALQRTVSLLVVLAAADERELICALARAQPLSFSDLAAGYLPTLGRVELWFATADSSTLTNLT